MKRNDKDYAPIKNYQEQYAAIAQMAGEVNRGHAGILARFPDAVQQKRVHARLRRAAAVHR